MRILSMAVAVLVFVVSGCCAGQQPSRHQAVAAGSTAPLAQIGIISYWSHDATAWSRVPAGSILVINPENGILDAEGRPVEDVDAWSALARSLAQRRIVVLGYVPTGYFDHTSCKSAPLPKCQTEERIRRQIETYYQKVPDVAGIFFDETSPKEGAGRSYADEFAFLRALNRTDRFNVFNVGWSSRDAVAAAKAGEHVVLYESSPTDYDKSAEWIQAVAHEARSKGLIVWHLLHSVADACAMKEYVQKIKQSGAHFGYVTNIGGNWEAGDPTWNELPTFWDEEVRAFSVPDLRCATQ